MVITAVRCHKWIRDGSNGSAAEIFKQKFSGDGDFLGAAAGIDWWGMKFVVMGKLCGGVLTEKSQWSPLACYGRKLK